MIHDGRSRFATSLREFLIARVGRENVPDAIAADAEPAVAEVNALGADARWVAVCPACGGAEYVWWDDPQFFCVGCRNEDIGGRFRPLVLPGNRAGIEAALMQRPARHRFWMPGETAADLERDNVEHGGNE